MFYFVVYNDFEKRKWISTVHHATTFFLFEGVHLLFYGN